MSSQVVVILQTGMSDRVSGVLAREFISGTGVGFVPVTRMQSCEIIFEYF